MLKKKDDKLGYQKLNIKKMKDLIALQRLKLNTRDHIDIESMTDNTSYESADSGYNNLVTNNTSDLNIDANQISLIWGTFPSRRRFFTKKFYHCFPTQFTMVRVINQVTTDMSLQIQKG